MINIRDYNQLNNVSNEEKKSMLVDVITHCMADNLMTLTILYDAIKIVEDFYKKNATIHQPL